MGDSNGSGGPGGNMEGKNAKGKPAWQIEEDKGESNHFTPRPHRKKEDNIKKEVQFMVVHA